MKLYFDGQLIDSLITSHSIQNSNDLFIGMRDNFTEFFKGSIDNFSLWDIALSQSEVQQYMTCLLYTSPSPRD